MRRRKEKREGESDTKKMKEEVRERKEGRKRRR